MELGQGDKLPSLSFRVDPRSGVPTYLQLVQQVEDATRLGILTSGDRLPTVREVVASSGINPNTVSKAYRELEHRGLTAARPGQGTFVIAAAPSVTARELARLQADMQKWIDQAARAGMDEPAMRALFEFSMQKLRAQAS